MMDVYSRLNASGHLPGAVVMGWFFGGHTGGEFVSATCGGLQIPPTTRSIKALRQSDP